MQMIGKIRLRTFFYRWKIVESEQCECGHTSQTVRHVLMKCRKFSRLRQGVWGVGDEKSRLE